MQFSNRFKRIWWFLSLIIALVLLILRWEAISSNNASSFDLGLLAVITGLAAVPIFTEFSFMGLTVKQQVESAKKEIKQDIREQIFDIKTELQNIVNVSSHIAPQFYLNYSPPDESLSKIKEEINSSLREVNVDRKYLGVDQLELSLELANDVQVAFSSRYQIEKEVRRIWEDFFQDEPPRRGMIVLLNELYRANIVPKQIFDSVREVSAIASPAIHGEPTSGERSRFLKDVVPPLLATLKLIRP